MTTPFDDVCCARIPRDALPRLASLRVEPGLRAADNNQHAWLRWEAGNERVVQTVMPIHEAVLFRFHGGHWHRFGERVPAFDFPADLEDQPLAHVLFPAPVQALPAPAPDVTSLRMVLERDERPRTTTALLGPITTIQAWSDTVPTSRLAALQGLRGNGNVLMIGDNLPLLDGAERFWGRDVLVPIGHAPAPALPESALKEIAGLQGDRILLWRLEQIDVIESALLAPLTREALWFALEAQG